MARSYCRGAMRVLRGGTTGIKPRSRASCRASSPSYARPSAGAMAWAPCPDGAAACALQARRGFGPMIAQTLWPLKHPRQPYESYWSIRRRTCQWLGRRFLRARGPVGRHLHDSAVQGHRFDLEVDFAAIGPRKSRFVGLHPNWARAAAIPPATRAYPSAAGVQHRRGGRMRETDPCRHLRATLASRIRQCRCEANPSLRPLRR
jgi:hypothetical protein